MLFLLVYLLSWVINKRLAVYKAFTCQLTSYPLQPTLSYYGLLHLVLLSRLLT